MAVDAPVRAPKLHLRQVKGNFLPVKLVISPVRKQWSRWISLLREHRVLLPPFEFRVVVPGVFSARILFSFFLRANHWLL